MRVLPSGLDLPKPRGGRTGSNRGLGVRYRKSEDPIYIHEDVGADLFTVLDHNRVFDPEEPYLTHCTG